MAKHESYKTSFYLGAKQKKNYKNLKNNFFKKDRKKTDILSNCKKARRCYES